MDAQNQEANSAKTAEIRAEYEAPKVSTTHNMSAGYIRFEAEADGVLYEGWVYEDGRPNRYGVDCQPVERLPNTTGANAVTAAAIRAMPILQAH